MELRIKRRTVKGRVDFQGLGLHTGVPVQCTIHPNDAGIQFEWNGAVTDALAENVTGFNQRTQLGEVHTIEHLMSAFAGLGVTDARVELTAPEVPALDGSSVVFCEGLIAAGFEELEESEVHGLFQRVYWMEEGLKIAIGVGEGHFKYVFDSGSRWPGVQEAEVWLGAEGDYLTQIAPARTLAFEEQVEPARAAGLGLGLDIDSCLILGSGGYVNEARFENEPARHKLLDLIGDLALSGYPLTSLNVVAEKSGHRSNVSAALRIREDLGLA